MRIFRVLLLTSLIATLAGSITVAILWKRGILQAWAQTRAVELYFEKVREELPFEVEKIAVKSEGELGSPTGFKDWNELLSGRLASLEMTLSRDDWRVHLEGALRFPPATTTTLMRLLGIRSRGSESLRVDYRPRVRIERKGGLTLPELPIHVWIRGTRGTEGLISVEGWGVETTVEKYQAAGNTEIESGALKAAWTFKDGLKIQANAKSVTWTKSAEQAVSVSEPKIDAEVPMKVQPSFEAGPEGQVRWAAGGAEILWNERYAALPSGLLAGRARVRFNSADLELGTTGALRVSAQKTGSALRIEAGTAKGKPLRLADAISTIIPIASSAGSPFSEIAAVLQNLDVRDGNLEGEARVSVGANAEGRIALRDLGLRARSGQWAIARGRVDLAYKNGEWDGELELPKIGARRLIGSLEPTRMKLRDSRVEISGVKTASEIPFKIQGLSTRLGAISGDFREGGLRTSFDLSPVTLSALAEPLCLGKNLPSATLQARFPEIVASPERIEAQGKLRAELFEGFIEADQLAISRPGTDRSEIGFNLNGEGMKLDYIGSFLGFGDMKGELRGYLKNVSVSLGQSGAPPRYELLLQLVPARRDKIVFSPEAMRNSVRLFAGDDVLDRIPGAVTLPFFSWFSREILRGFDLNYAGLKVKSADGFIVVETLDDPKVVEDTGKHFIMHGHRFKIALESSRYPLIMDAEAATRYVDIMRRVMAELAAEKKTELKEPDSNAQISNCDPVGF